MSSSKSALFLLLLLLLLPPLSLVACDRARTVKRPGDDVEVKNVRLASAFPDDCTVHEIPADCRAAEQDVEARITCVGEPSTDKRVATIKRCLWPQSEAAFRRAVCRAGGDTVLHKYTVTDSECVGENSTTVGLGVYAVYRVRSD